MTNKFKTLLKTSAALATLFSGAQTFAATLNEACVMTTSVTGGVSVAVPAGGATTVAPTLAAAGANDLFIHARGLCKEDAAVTWSLPTVAACLQPVTQIFELTGITGTATVGVTVPRVAPGDKVVIYDGSLLSGARTLTTTTFAFGTNWTEETKINNSSKLGVVEWMGPIEPAFAETAGVQFKFKKTTTAGVINKMRP